MGKCWWSCTFLGTSAAGLAAEARLGVLWAAIGSPGSSSGGPGAVCKLLWGLEARAGAAAEVVAGPELVPGQHFPGLIIHNTFSPHAFF